MGDSKRWSAADFAAVAWVALHVYASVQSFRHGLYQTYTGRTWVLLTIWLLGLLALDAWLSAGRPGMQRRAGDGGDSGGRAGFDSGCEWLPCVCGALFLPDAAESAAGLYVAAI